MTSRMPANSRVSDRVKSEFEGRTQAFQTELRDRLKLAKCGFNDSVQEHLDRMCYMCENAWDPIGSLVS